jgi:hypothetical protein
VRHLVRTSFALALCVAPVSADVIVVNHTAGPGVDYTQVSAAVAAAADGDTILVRPGYYSQPVVIVDKSLHIHGDGTLPVYVKDVSVLDLSAGKTVVLQGLTEVAVGLHNVATPGLLVSNCQGMVRVSGCSFLGSEPGSAFCCGAFGAAPGVSIVASASVALVDCYAEGGPGDHVFLAPDWIDGAAGIRVHDSTVSLAHVQAVGGEGGQVVLSGAYGGQGGAGVHLGGGQCELYGSTVRGGDGGATTSPAAIGGVGGDGLRSVTGGALVHTLDPDFTGGAAGAGFPPGPAGLPQNVTSGVLDAHAGVARHLGASSPVREGGSATYAFEGLPGESVLLLVSATTSSFWSQKFHGTLLVGSAFALVPFGETDGSGVLSVSFTLPELGPGVEAVTLFLQPFFSGTRAGGYLGPMQPQLLLDAAF